MNRRTRSRVMAVILASVLVLTLVGSLLSTTTDPGTGDTTTGDTVDLVDGSLLPPVTQASDLPPIQLVELPGEAIETLGLIAQGGPFPYDRDGLTFQNREGLLPERPEGWYREYTVVTPGEDDRGARRLVVGERDEVFYTDDHYASFRELVLG